MLLRVLDATSGNAFVNGIDVTTTDATNDLFLDMGYCPQTNALFELMTGEEMLDFFTKMRGVDDETRPSYVANCLANANLGAHATKQCRKYSGGNKRKLCFAIAICGDPKMTVLDESSAGVDVAARKKLWSVLQSLLSRGNTVVMTTHHMEEAQNLAHRAAIMVDGKLSCLGTAQHLQEKYGGGYELSIFCKEGGGDMDGLLERLEAMTGRATEVLERTASSYCRLGLGKIEVGQFGIADVFELMSKEKQSGNVVSYTLNQTGLEEVFLTLTQSRSRKGKRVKGAAGEGDWGMWEGGEGGGQGGDIANVLNLTYTPSKGLHRNETVPYMLAGKGLSQDVWDDFVGDRLAKISKEFGFLVSRAGCQAACMLYLVPPLR